MKIILLSGGSGQRLWPLSNDLRSKQFLKVLEHEGEKESMVQRVWRQLKNNNLSHLVSIATSKSQVEILKSQVGNNVPLIVEPERRDTFPAIFLASIHLYSEQKASDDEVVVVLPVDPYVEDEFFSKLKELENLISTNNSDIALIGALPTYPSSKYGYIVPKFESGEISNSVEKFVEKPSEKVAERLLSNNAYWNCGVFAFKLKTLLDTAGEYIDTFTFDYVVKNYFKLPKISFDYEFVEKCSNISFVPYEGYWKDLGTWNTLTDEIISNKTGNGKLSFDSSNTHLINELDIPVTILGIKDAVVIASSDGILVSSKSESHKIKEHIGSFENTPKYIEKSWGSIRTLDYSEYNNNLDSCTNKIHVLENKCLPYQKHMKKEKIWTILNGEAEVIVDEVIHFVKSGDTIHIKSNVYHSIVAKSDLNFLEVETGVSLSQDDTIIKEYDWERIKDNYYNSRPKIIL